MTAVRTQTLLDRHVGERVTIVTVGGGITGTLNSVTYSDVIGERDQTPTAVHLVATEPLDAPVTIPWHAIITFARMPDPDIPALTTRVEMALDGLDALADAVRVRSSAEVRTIYLEAIDDLISTLNGTAP